MFGKIFKNKKKEDELKRRHNQEAAEMRIAGIVNQIGLILEEKKVNFYEMADVLGTLYMRYHQNVFKLMKGLEADKRLAQEQRDKETERANELISKYEYDKQESKEN
jgi:hypothetical protein